MKLKAQDLFEETAPGDLKGIVDLSTDEALGLALSKADENNELDTTVYEELSGKLNETQQAAFTSGLVDKGIKVMSKKQASSISIPAKLKNHFIALVNKQGCLYEDDYHNACYSITDSKLIGAINNWILSAGLPLKKNKPKFDTEYKKKVKDIAKHPSIDKLKKKAQNERNNVQRWMWNNVEDYAGEGYEGFAKYTEFAENAALEINHPEWLDNPDHWIWDLSIDILDKYNRQNKKAAKDETKRPDPKKSFPDKMPNSDLVNKPKYPELSSLNKVIKELKDKEFKTEFLPPWKKKEAQADELGGWATDEAETWLLNDEGLYHEAINLATTIGNNYPDIANALEDLITNAGIMEENDLVDVDWNGLAASVLDWEEVKEAETEEDIDPDDDEWKELLSPEVREKLKGLEEKGAVGQEYNMYDDGNFPIGGEKEAEKKIFVIDKTKDSECEEPGRKERSKGKGRGLGKGKGKGPLGVPVKEKSRYITESELREYGTDPEKIEEAKKNLVDQNGKRIFAQRIDEEKRQLEDTIRAREDQIPNAQSLLQKVRNAFDFSELRNIWEQLKAIPAFATNPDPVEASIQVEANKEFQSATAKKKVQFENAAFMAHIAQTELQKAAGLEAFEELKPNEGMLFPFNEPSHVTFHMGSVKFPIDIIFLMEDPTALKVAKIIHNAQPGAVEHWSCPNTSYVLEVVGGTAKKNGIGVGSECLVKDRISYKG